MKILVTLFGCELELVATVVYIMRKQVWCKLYNNIIKIDKMIKHEWIIRENIQNVVHYGLLSKHKFRFTESCI